MNVTPIQTSLNTESRLASVKAAAPKFGIGQAVWNNMAQNFVWDTATILLPKTAIDLKERGKLQAFESWYLELIEDLPFYCATQLSAFYAFAPLFQKIAKLPKGAASKNLIGTALKNIKSPSNALVGAKAATVLSVMTLTMGWEFLIEHTKNAVTAKLFNTKNFTGVANLEKGREKLHHGEIDPVEKAGRRIKQVGGLMAGLFGLALALPSLVKSNKAVAAVAKKALNIVDFSGLNAWDMSRVMFFMVCGIAGFSGYIDASRDGLERREKALRLALVVPNLTFGKAILETALGGLFQKLTVGKGAERFVIGDKVRFLDPSLFQKDSIFGINLLRSKDAIKQDLAKLRISSAAKQQILNRHWFITGIPKFVVGGLGVGAILTYMVYRSTQNKYKERRQNLKKILDQNKIGQVALPKTADGKLDTNKILGYLNSGNITFSRQTGPGFAAQNPWVAGYPQQQAFYTAQPQR